MMKKVTTQEAVSMTPTVNYVGEAPTEESMAAKGNWKGGYREDGGYDGVSEYDRDGNYVGTLEDYLASEESYRRRNRFCECRLWRCGFRKRRYRKFRFSEYEFRGFRKRRLHFGWQYGQHR